MMLRRLRRFRDRNRPDLHFPGLTRGQAGELRAALRRTLAEKGATVRFDSRHAIIDHPRQGRVAVNLENLIRDVGASQHPKAPRSMARAFLSSVLDSEPSHEWTTADLYAGLRLRIAATTHLVPEEQDIVTAATLRGFTDDTAVTLVLDTERTIQTMPLDRLRDHDDVDTLVRAARNNLRTELLDADVHTHIHPASEDHPGAHFRSFESGSYYTATAPVLFPDILEAWAPELDHSRGILFAMPTRHILLVREITTGEDLLEGLGRLAPVAAQLAVDGAHAVSPLLHMWHEGEVTTLTSFDQEARELKITPTPYLLELMSAGDD
ncbi:MAG: hypothetical protein Q4G50_01045 [Corynebacterium sp.]|uniref:hypothetical protein n=1 Tax=Corynebacterium sp. TaxID=1720 RepID=UPI0026DED82F|nr:hypothetical protein [Corynebacterium sp.]MDO5668568.1 hypothetical protein [Corynebacterium sp.]